MTDYLKRLVSHLYETSADIEKRQEEDFTFDPFDYLQKYDYLSPILSSNRCIMTEEEKARLDLLANCIIEDSERVTIPDSDTKALHAEIVRLRAKCETYKQALAHIDRALGRLNESINKTLNL